MIHFIQIFFNIISFLVNSLNSEVNINHKDYTGDNGDF